MRMVFPNCRAHFTAEDIAFMAAVLTAGDREAGFLKALLTDPDVRDGILDDERLLRAIQDRGDCLTISAHLYFYVLVRHVLRQAGIPDVEAADYVAELLAEYSCARRLLPPLWDPALRADYLIDLLLALPSVRDREYVALTEHIGNFALFVAGLYPQWIESRRQHQGAPGLEYFEHVGQWSFEEASRHPAARALGLSDLLAVLAASFHSIRLALNQLGERLIFTASSPLPPDIPA